MTCGAYPEQYDVFLNGKQFGYLRLRHGSFTATYPDVYGDDAYQGSPKGDGIFEEDERMFFLKEACDSLIAMHNEKALQRIDDANYAYIE
jgi:hypothetical protein